MIINKIFLIIKRIVQEKYGEVNDLYQVGVCEEIAPKFRCNSKFSEGLRLA